MEKLVNLVSSFNDIMNVKVAGIWVGKESKLQKRISMKLSFTFEPCHYLRCSNLNTDEITNGLKKSWSHYTEANWCWCAINGLKLLLCTICYHYAHIHTHLSSGSARVDTNVTLSPSIAKHYGVEIPPTLMEWKQGRMNGISFTFVVYNILRTRQATTSLLEGTKSLWRWKYRMVDFIIFLTANSDVTLV